MGFWVSWFLGFSVSGFLGFWVSRFLGSVRWLLGFLVSRLGSRSVDFSIAAVLVSCLLRFWGSCSSGFLFIGSLGFWVSSFLGFASRNPQLTLKPTLNEP